MTTLMLLSVPSTNGVETSKVLAAFAPSWNESTRVILPALAAKNVVLNGQASEDRRHLSIHHGGVGKL
jgi:hypothetical protein